MNAVAEVNQVNKGKKLYWATMPFMNFVFPNGKVAVFRHYRFATEVPSEIEVLDREVAGNHPYIYVKQDALYLTEEMEDPMKALRKKIIADYLAEQAKFVDPTNDMGNTAQEPIRPQSTSDIASVAAGGDATQSAAKLVALTNKMASEVSAAKK